MVVIIRLFGQIVRTEHIEGGDIDRATSCLAAIAPSLTTVP